MSCKSIKTLSQNEYENFLNSFDVVLSDCDGVLWMETEAVPGSPAAVAQLKRLGKKFFYITNHNGKTRKEFAEKCTRLDYEAAEGDILSSAYLVAAYLKERNFDKKVYVFGSEGAARELEAVGIKHCGNGPDVLPKGSNDVEVVSNFKRDPEVGAVVVASDQHLSFPKFIKAATYASDPNVLFIGTNPDLQKPTVGEVINPGDGCFIKAVEFAAGRKAVIVGKPEPFVSEMIQRKYGVNPSRTLIVGDNLSTDILLGKRCGFKTLLVLTGVTTYDKLQAIKNGHSPLNGSKLPSSVLPDFYAERLSDIFQR